jgi:glycosyltransferase involved in cell wall biosynthesis
VIWGLGNFGLRRPPCPQAIHYFDAHLVYDPRKQPRQLWHNGLEMRMVHWRLLRSLPATDLVFCQTNTMLTRFRETFAYPGEMVVMPTAVSRFALSEAARPAVFERLAGKFVLLALTRYYPHKNLEVLVEMFQRHSAALDDVVVLLTIDPAQKYGVERFLAGTAQPGVSKHFLNVGPVKQSELAGYFRHSRALIQPTVLESFSSTYLEAMQFETPILTSDLDFAREVCGEAALYFDPWNADAVFAALQQFRASPELGRELARRGTERMQSYFRSWEEIVGAALRRIESLGGGRRATDGVR